MTERLTDEALEELLCYDLHDAKGELCRTSDHDDQSWGMSIPACEIIDTTEVVKSLARELLAYRRAGVEPAAWRCKGYGDVWIIYPREAPARRYQEATGCLLHPRYAAPPPTSRADAELRAAAEAVIDSAERPGSRKVLGNGIEDDTWEDYQEVPQEALDALCAALSTPAPSRPDADGGA
ncbi:MAG: hypothetical protein ACK4NW_12830 [Roseinatronobacter sp.]